MSSKEYMKFMSELFFLNRQLYIVDFFLHVL